MSVETEISGLLDRAYHFTYGDGADPRTGNALATEAVGRGLLALIPLVREIGDQLDTLPRKEPEPAADPLWDAPLYRSAVVIERFGLGAFGPDRERSVALLVLGAVTRDHREGAEAAAVRALAAAHDAGPAQVKAVKAAIDTLGIDIEDAD